MLQVLFQLLPAQAFGQPAETCKWIRVYNQPVILDCMSVAEKTIHIHPSIDFKYSLATGAIIILSAEKPMPDSVQVCYQSLPFALHQNKYRRNISGYDSSVLHQVSTGKAIESAEKRRKIEWGDISRQGMLSRNLTSGNQQSLVMDSELDLQLEGKLTENLWLKANISDQNRLYQPDGSSMYIQDPNRVLVKVYNRNFSLEAGDLQLNSQTGFLKYNRNVQGGKLEFRQQISENLEGVSAVGVSINRHKFCSQQVEVKQGIQGPYKLRGNRNERFIIILAGTEKVFLDGNQLERGLENDYVIDYNLAEITFTPGVLLHNYSRLLVEFEYTDFSFNKVTRSIHQTIKSNKSETGFYHFSEKDTPGQDFNGQFSSSDRDFLSSLGDNAELAWISSIDSSGYLPGQLLYAAKDTFDLDGNAHKVYFFSEDPGKAHYRLIFNELGEGKGNYRFDGYTARGKVFHWVSPVEGIPQGNFEPVIQAALPVKLQVTGLQHLQHLSSHDFLQAEFAVSRFDQNTFSGLDDHNNLGTAWKIRYYNKARQVGESGILWQAKAGLERVDGRFTTPERFRPVEFNRRWNIDPSHSKEIEIQNLANLGIILSDRMGSAASYSVDLMKLGSNKGNQHQLTINKTFHNLSISGSWNNLSSENAGSAWLWRKSEAEFSYLGKHIVPGYQFQAEKNSLSLNDSLLGSQLNYREHLVFIRNPDSSLQVFDFSWAIRQESGIKDGEFQKTNLVNILQGSYKLISAKTQMLFSRFSFTKNENFLEQVDLTEQNAMGQLIWQANFWKKRVKISLDYGINNGRELKREFIFLPVPVGQGTHTWRDLDQDGEQDLNEFMEAVNPDEKQFAKLFSPSDEYLPAFENSLNFRTSWKLNQDRDSFWSRFSGVLEANQRNKTSSGSVLERVLPFHATADPDQLITAQHNLRYRLIFNEANPEAGWAIGRQTNYRKQLYTSGFESRNLNFWNFEGRMRLIQGLILNLEAEKGRIAQHSEIISGKNFTIDKNILRTILNWQQSSIFKMSGHYHFRINRNMNEVGEAIIRQFGLELQTTGFSEGSNLKGAVILDKVDFSGQEYSVSGYELMESLSPGNNLRFNLEWRQYLMENLGLSLFYQARTRENNPIIHFGRVQIQAVF